VKNDARRRRKIKPQILTVRSYAEGLRSLAGRDPDLAHLLDAFGAPPEWFREPGFPTLIHIILEQQISLASAKAAFTRLLALATPLTPASFLSLDDAELKRAGFSRQKTAYGRHLARSIMDGELDLEALVESDDATVKAELLKVKGIGEWTADIYLLMALRRPDAWPAKDLALMIALQEVKRLGSRPTPAELETLAEQWRPHRAVAARLLWQYYLHRPAKQRRRLNS
jgi:DNA-3-methyladenine glycosylase II